VASAVQTLKDVMEDCESPASSRVTAAKAVIEMAYKAYEMEDMAAELDEIKQYIEANKAGSWGAGMLKNELKSIRKELQKISAVNQGTEIYFVAENDGEYIVTTAEKGTIVFQGSTEEYEVFDERHPKSFFIHLNVPRPLSPNDLAQ
jgi:hypothetical protein